MADITADTSSYPKALPTKSLLDTAQQLGGMQQQAIGIDQQKLELFNKKYDLLNRTLRNYATDEDVKAGNEAGQKKIVDASQNLVKMGAISPEDHAKFVSAMPTDPKQIPGYVQKALELGMHTQESVNWMHGQMGLDENGQQRTPTLSSPRPGFSPTGMTAPAGLPIQQQAGPTTAVIGPDGKPMTAGAQNPQLPPNAAPAPNGLPGQFSPGSNAPIVPKPVRTLPVTAPTVAPNQVVTPPIAAPGSPNARVSQGFEPRGFTTGFAPGVKQAADVTGQASGEQLAIARKNAANYQREVFPLEQAIPLLEKLGTKGTGPGTEAINHLKSFVLSNVPGVTEESFKGLNDVASYDKVKKYLTDFVNQTGSSGTNDKLAAAFAGNPSVGISNAAAQDVSKAALALRRMKQAETLEFHKTGLSDDQFSKWAVNWNNTQDARGYGFDLMSKDKQEKLIKSLNLKQLEVFKHSVAIAHRSDLTNPIPEQQ